MSAAFTTGLRQIATISDCRSDWGCGKNGSRFRCHMCGHKFVPNDGHRWIYMGGRSYEQDGKQYTTHNPIICDTCDGPNIEDRFIEHTKEFHQRFWAFVR